jgi:hypothetical protein
MIKMLCSFLCVICRKRIKLINSGGIALGYGLDDRGFESRQELGIFLLTTVSGPALGPTQSPNQWVPGALSLGVKQTGREADHSPPSCTEVKNAWSCTSNLSIRLHGVVLSSGTGVVYLLRDLNSKIETTLKLEYQVKISNMFRKLG